MTYRIVLDELVLKEDLPRLDRPAQQLVLRNIRRKLSRDPKALGKPLSGKLKNYWRLRVGNYRVIYRILEEEIVVYVVKVGFRRDEEVYLEMARRFKLL